MEKDFFANLSRDRDEAVAQVRSSAQTLAQSREQYERAVLQAHRLGVTNTSIALAANRTEAAIRLFIKRKKRNGR